MEKVWRESPPRDCGRDGVCSVLEEGSVGQSSRRRQTRSLRVTPEADPGSVKLGHKGKAGWDSTLKRNFLALQQRSR